jgi:hypothetical protein
MSGRGQRGEGVPKAVKRKREAGKRGSEAGSGKREQEAGSADRKPEAGTGSREARTGSRKRKGVKREERFREAGS